MQKDEFCIQCGREMEKVFEKNNARIYACVCGARKKVDIVLDPLRQSFVQSV